MNGLDIPEAFSERVIRRCGRVHPHDDLRGDRTALVVIDLQNAFMDDTVGHAVCPMARDIVPTVNRLAGAVPEAGGGVFWIKNTYDSRSATEWSQSDAMMTATARARRIAAMSEGSKGHELWPDLDIQPDDEVVRKYRFSAFLPGTCELPVQAACAPVRYRSDCGNRHQCVLRKFRPRCDDDEFSHGDGH